MQKAGGHLAIIGALFAVFAAVFTLAAGGAGHSFGTPHPAHATLSPVWWGLALACACIVIGAVALHLRSRIPGLLLIAASVAGAILGGTPVAVCMALVLAGGALCVLARREAETATAA